MARFRGPGFGEEENQKTVECHEIKTGFFRHEQSVRSESDRGLISEKSVVRWLGKPIEFGRRLGMGRPCAKDWDEQRKLALSDGSKWIWNMVEDRWPHARQLLDFYHASEHLWNLGRAHETHESKARAGVEAGLHRMRHGQEKSVFEEIADRDWPSGSGAVESACRQS
jgi:hypothetical protein